MDIRHDETVHETLRQTPRGPWPEDSPARVPYWVYQDEANYKREMQRLFEGATWNFVCLEADIPNKGDYRTNHVGTMPVIVVREGDGSINAFENRCAHRGALIAFDDSGNVENNFRCIYHAWSYDLAGNLKDTYHASLLHLFFATFRITRLTQAGGVMVSPDGAHHASYTIGSADAPGASAYREQGLRSESDDYKLVDPSLLDTVEEFGDHIQLQILSIFPGLVLQQIHNCLAV